MFLMGMYLSTAGLFAQKFFIPGTLVKCTSGSLNGAIFYMADGKSIAGCTPMTGAGDAIPVNKGVIYTQSETTGIGLPGGLWRLGVGSTVNANLDTTYSEGFSVGFAGVFAKENLNLIAGDVNSSSANQKALTLMSNGEVKIDFCKGRASAADCTASSSPGNFQIQRNGTPLMTVTANGNVGIRVANPSYQLDVAGYISVSGSAGSSVRHNVDYRGSYVYNSDAYYGAATSGKSTYLRASGSTQMTLKSDGNVGIGTTNPLFPLHIGKARNSSTYSNVSELGYIAANGYLTYNTGFYAPNSYLHNYRYYSLSNYRFTPSIFAYGAIYAGGAFVSVSDARKKINLGVSDKAKDLEILKQIKVTNYVKKDPNDRHHSIQKKVIAQELKKVYPTAVNISSGEVPDVFQFGKNSTYKNGVLTTEIDSVGDLKKDDVLKLFLRNKKDTTKEETFEKVTLTKVDGKKLIFSVSKDDQKKLGKSQWDVFVYGRQVNDVHNVDYDAVSMLNVSATQALAEKVEAMEKTNDFLKLLVYGLGGLVLLLLLKSFRKKK